MSQEHKLYRLYQLLFEMYGPQGWWPIISDKPMHQNAYHPGDYSFPKNRLERFEICLGAILTQNTTFISVVKALDNLKALDALSPKGIGALDEASLKQAIRPAGYFNQKAKYILEFLSFFEALNGEVPARKSLLDVHGIGEETADSILLYAYGQPEFVVDAYTKRILSVLGFIEEKTKYKEVKALIQEALELSVPEEERVKVYQEYHALFVAHAKLYYAQKPYGTGCMMKEMLGVDPGENNMNRTL